MPISIEIEPETGIAIAICSGVLRVHDAKQGATALWTTPGWKGTSAVWDFREAQFDVTASNVREIAEFVVKNQPTTPPARVAFVTGRDVDFGLARIYEVFRDDAATAFRVFRDYDEAIMWAWSLGTDTA